VGQVFDRDGSDAMRWFLMSSPILRGADLVVTEAGIRESVRQAVLPLWNTWYFLALYSKASDRVGTWRTDSTDVLDRYVLSKTAELVREVGALLDVYDLAGACASVRLYLEGLTNWYIRRSRQRFWDADPDAIDTLHTVLEVVSRVVAPLLPLTSEVIWRGLTGERSVHLTDWPAADELPVDAELVAAMDEIREIASVSLSVRKGASLRVRQPLASLTVATKNAERLQPFVSLLSSEVNVRSVDVTELADHDARVSRQLLVNARAAGPRLGRDVQKVIKASKSGDWTVADDGSVVCGGVALVEGEYSLELVAAGSSSDAVGLLKSGGFVSLDTVLDDELLAQGAVNDLLRLAQQARKEAGLQVSDRIDLTLEVPDELWAAVQTRVETVKAETLAILVSRGDVGAERPGVVAGTVGAGNKVRVGVIRAGG
jgi:isoleucyl-tRNA synthetase